MPGRIEKLQVNYVGAEVEAGAPLATVFSPEMLTAQRQYVERIKAGAVASSLSERAAARERLLELGLTEEEIRILEGTLKPTAMVNIRAPLSGTVVSPRGLRGPVRQDQRSAVRDRRLLADVVRVRRLRAGPGLAARRARRWRSRCPPSPARS